MPIMMDVVFNPWHVTPGNLQFIMLGLQHRRHLLEASLAALAALTAVVVLFVLRADVEGVSSATQAQLLEASLADLQCLPR